MNTQRKLGKQIENRLIASGKVSASVTAHAEATAEALSALAKEAGVNVPAATFKHVLGAFDAILTHTTRKLEAAELAYSAEQADDVPVRAKRESTTNELIELAVKAAGSVQNQLGLDGLKNYGLDGTTPRAPRRLLGYVKNAVNLLAQVPQTVTNAFGEKFSTEKVRVLLDEKSGALEAALKDVDREERELQNALGLRDQVLGLWTPRYQGIAGAVSDIYKMIGRDDLSDKVKPTERTLSGEDAGPEEGAPQEGGAGGESNTGG